VLVVDDDPAVRGLIAGTLVRAGYRVVSVSCADDAIRASEGDEFAVVLTDVNMPGSMSGLELIDALHARRPGLPIIPVSGSADEASFREALDRGAAGFITKPFTAAELREKVDRALGRVLLTEVELRDRLLAPTVASVLANAIEVRDSGMEGHTDRLAALALELGRLSGVAAADLEALEIGAVLHDVGKIGIRDSILLKPGALTRGERTAMEAHAEIGDEMLAPLELLQQVRPIVRHHHERWDGAGYPDGLAGEEIPILARIVSVADSIEAMSGPRSYRVARGLAGVVRELELGSGSQWDPAIVENAITLIHAGRLRIGPAGLQLIEA
jgi:putative two-component system response regulator